MPKKPDTLHVQLIVSRIAPDRTPYKAYGLEFIPQKMLVSVPVDAEYVSVVYKTDAQGKETDEADYVVLSLDGLMQVTGQIADKVDALHTKFMRKVQG